MLVSTTETVDGARVAKYIGVVTGEAIVGANFLRDLMASITDVIGGRAAAYERSLQEAKDSAMRQMVEEAQKRGANAVIGIDLDYHSIFLGGDKGSMLMVAANGTAVILE